VLQKHIYTFILLLIGVICFGQTATISGTVKDDDGVSIPDVQIAILEDGPSIQLRMQTENIT